MHGVRDGAIEGDPELRGLLERAAVSHRSSAALLRARGGERQAARLEQFASRARLRLDEPQATRRMRELALRVCDAPHLTARLERALEGAISLAGADFGNVQIRDGASGGLRIVCQCGFDRGFLEYFAEVDDASSACGRAARRRAQTVIVDVNRDPGFAPHREIAAASGFRAVQSTPLIDRLGHLLGVLSIHYRRPRRPLARDLEIMQWYGELVGAAMVETNRTPAARLEERPSSDPAAGVVSELDGGKTSYRYAEDARRHVDNAGIARAESMRLLRDAVTAHEEVAVLHDHAVVLYRRLAENMRGRGHLGGSSRSEVLAALHRERARAARARAEQARRTAVVHKELELPGP